MDFVQAPKGCRHSQLTQYFTKNSTFSSTQAALNGICHGGCDVCDARLEALRDLSVPSRHILQAVADASAGISEQAVLQQLVSTAEQMHICSAEVQHITAFWVGLLHELSKMGLIQQHYLQSHDIAPAMQLTAAGVQELQGLAEARISQAHVQHCGTSALGGSQLRTKHMRCSKILVQSLRQPCGEQTQTLNNVDHQIKQGRRGLERFCAVLEDEKLLPSTLLGVLPCLVVDVTVCDLPLEMLRSFKVDLGMWACMGQVILSLARGCDPGMILRSDAFSLAKKKWIGAAAIQTPAVRREAMLAADQVQAKAVQSHKAVMRARVALGKLSRKLESQGKHHQGQSCTVLTTELCEDIIKAAPMTEVDLLLIPRLPTEVIQAHGNVILQLLRKAFEGSSEIHQHSTAMHHTMNRNMDNPVVNHSIQNSVPLTPKQDCTTMNTAAARFARKRKR
eukprot:jgi/Ulvmu1/1709/UM116_0022.1